MIVKRAVISWMLILLTTGVAGATLATEHAEPVPAAATATYHFVLLRSVAGVEPIGERAIQALQEEHIRYLERLLADGKLLLSGPIDRGGELRRVAVLNVGSVEEAEAIVRRDPWVRAGRLEAEIHPWSTAANILRPPGSVLRSSPCTVGLLLRPADPPDYTDERLREIRSGHLDNIRTMAESGDLVLAGPTMDDGVLRGVLVFRALDVERLASLVARDPALEAGLFGAELYRWHVPEGTLPER